MITIQARIPNREVASQQITANRRRVSGSQHCLDDGRLTPRWRHQLPVAVQFGSAQLVTLGKISRCAR